MRYIPMTDKKFEVLCLATTLSIFLIGGFTTVIVIYLWGCVS